MILNKLRLDQILFNRKLAESKSKAQAMIMAGQVYVEGKLINKSGYNIDPDSIIEEMLKGVKMLKSKKSWENPYGKFVSNKILKILIKEYKNEN